MRPLSSTLLLTVLAALLAACATPAPGGAPAAGAGGPAPELSRKLSRFVYIEEGTDIVMTVGSRAAAFHEADRYFPLEVSVTNRMKRTTLVITRESFTLIDEAGNRYEMPTHEDLVRGYDKRTFDTNLFEARAVTASKLEGYRQVESNFFPDPTLGIRRRSDTVSGLAGVAPRSTSLVPIERVELSSMSFMEDVLYFPHPGGELVGQRLSLELRAEGLSEPARVAFRVPEI